MRVDPARLVLIPHHFHSSLLIVHKASFYLWLVATGVHLAGHFAEAFGLASKDWMDRVRGAVVGAPVRLGAVLLSLALGGVLALALGSTAATYQQQYLQPGGAQVVQR